MKRIITLSFFFLFCLGAGFAQTNCGPRYQQLMEEAEKAFKDHDYRNAYEKYKAARGCKLADFAYIDRQMDASMDGIDQQRLDAQMKEEQAKAATAAAQRAIVREELAKKGLESAKKDLEQALAVAKEAQEKAEGEKDRADKLAAEIQQKFEELKSANSEKIAGLLQLGSRYLQKMEYDSAYDLCQTIHNVPGGRERARALLSELLFFYSESGQLDKSTELLNLAGLSQIKASRSNISSLLKDWNKGFFDTLLLRYYPDIVQVNKGYFLMGADYGRDGTTSEEAPLHYEFVNRFGLGKTEVTNRQYAVYAARNETAPRRPTTEKQRITRGIGAELPVSQVSWLDAIAYLNWLSLQMGKEPCYEKKDSTMQPGAKQIVWVDIRKNAGGYRLPTEIEWEYAARGGPYLEQMRYPGSQTSNEVAWEKRMTSTAQPVAILRPNALGLYDMSGNVAEYCWDIFVPYTLNNSNYANSLQKYHPLEIRINRSSNFTETNRFPELAQRDHLNMDYQSDQTGFRVAITSK